MQPPLDVEPTAWLFTRGNASVRMTVAERPWGLVLTVLGPGTASAAYDFPDKRALVDFVSLQEQHLRTEGFQLQATVERRSSDRRGGEQREGFVDRRRR